MKNYLYLTPFERLLNHHFLSINEASLAVFAINPNTKTQDIPKDFQDDIKDVRKAMVRNIRAIEGLPISASSDLASDIVFGAAYQFINASVTPLPITERAKEAIENISRTNSWESTLYCLGGRALVNEGRLLRKSGRGAHRKDDEKKGTDKLIGLLIKLLADKHHNGKYGSHESPLISEIYADLLKLSSTHQINMSGVGKSTFYEKVKRALLALSDD